ncbi:MAG: TIGR04283 family arsenosugar biosynthesis glycosyltransferase [Candidatus Competibacteraceae bacterium]
MPILNEAAVLDTVLQPLQALRRQGCELIVVDGGSNDASVEIAGPWADRVMTAPAGRAVQMNAGAQVAQGDALWFLHGDSLPPPDPDRLIAKALQFPNRVWGRFNVRLSGSRPVLRMVETLMNWRSCLTGIATGDQGIFVRRSAFEKVGGYPVIPLMEDIALSRTLKRISRPACISQRLMTSSRRWEQNGIFRTIALMWRLRLVYYLGADPARLARLYYGR